MFLKDLFQKGSVMSTSKKSNWHVIIFILLAAFGFSRCQGQTNIVDVILKDKSSFFYLDTQNYPAQRNALPVGVFDSGTGGLTVLDAIVNLDEYDNKTCSLKKGGDGLRDLRKEYFIYLGDQANMPYSNYTRENKTDVLVEHIIKDVQFLLGNKYYLSANDAKFQTDKQPVKTIVIGCNTATAYGKAKIEQLLKSAGLDIKVIGVIDAGSRAALKVFGKDEEGSIAVFASAGTVTSKGYVKALNALKAEMGYTGEITIFQQSGIALSSAIDGIGGYIAPGAATPQKNYVGISPDNADPRARIDMSMLKRYGFEWEDNKMLFEGTAENPKNLQLNSVSNNVYFHVVSLMEKIRKTPGAKKLKAIILGCTHYPFVVETVENKLKELYNYRENGQYLYRPFMAEHIELIDPAPNTARELYEHLAESRLFNDENLYKSEFYISVPNKLNSDIKPDSAGNFTYEYKYGRSAGAIQEYVKRVPFDKKNINAPTLKRLAEKTPMVFELMRIFNCDNPKTAALKKDDKI